MKFGFNSPTGQVFYILNQNEHRNKMNNLLFDTHANELKLFKDKKSRNLDFYLSPLSLEPRREEGLSEGVQHSRRDDKHLIEVGRSMSSSPSTSSKDKDRDFPYPSTSKATNSLKLAKSTGLQRYLTGNSEKNKQIVIVEIH